jgi:quercetin dioxygenase-like cupin family protein
MIVRRADRRPRQLQPGVQHTVLSYTDELMLCEVALAQGSVFPTHSHLHVQIVYVVSGRITLTRDAGPTVLVAGDSCALGANESHGVVALEDSIVLDAFAPARADFIEADRAARPL